MKKIITLSFIIVAFALSANNITVSNLTLEDQDFSAGTNNAANFIKVQFDISWENSWKTTTSPSNWDAAWVFVKYRIGTGDWIHGYLNNTGHVVPAGYIATPGLRTTPGTFNAASNPALGVFISRSADGIGTSTLTSVQLQWNYRRNPDYPVLDDDDIEVAVYAVEMVYVNAGSFWVGNHGLNGPEVGAFRSASGGTYGGYGKSISNENSIVIGTSNGNLWGTVAGAYATGVTPSTIGPAGTLAAAFPKGTLAFYCMKYEITQQQYVDFLNSLTRIQQSNRIVATISNAATAPPNNWRYRMFPGGAPSPQKGNSIACSATFTANEPIPFMCDLSGNGIGGEANDGQWKACNYLLPADVSAYLAWSGLRPMTEFEFEKACRGNNTAYPPADYPWGVDNLNAGTFTISNAGTSNETIATGYNGGLGNANMSNSGIGVPTRVGIFALNNIAEKVPSASTFFGIKDMSGNILETVISIGVSAAGRNYTGIHGTGKLDVSGNTIETSWTGFGFRGSAFAMVGPTEGRVADRTMSSYIGATTNIIHIMGGRGVRLAP